MKIPYYKILNVLKFLKRSEKLLRKVIFLKMRNMMLLKMHKDYWKQKLLS